MCVVMTDKATVVIPSPRRWKVVETMGKEGEIAKVHSTLVVLEVEGGAGAEPQAAAPRPPTGQEAPSIPPRAAGEPAPLSTAPGPAQYRAAQGSTWAGSGPAPSGGNGEQRGRGLATPVPRRQGKEEGARSGSPQG